MQAVIQLTKIMSIIYNKFTNTQLRHEAKPVLGTKTAKTVVFKPLKINIFLHFSLGLIHVMLNIFQHLKLSLDRDCLRVHISIGLLGLDTCFQTGEILKYCNTLRYKICNTTVGLKEIFISRTRFK